MEGEICVSRAYSQSKLPFHRASSGQAAPCHTRATHLALAVNLVARAPQPTSTRPKLLVLEFWGLGDLTFVTPLLRAAREIYDITLVGKEHAAQLLQPTFPDIRFIDFDAPWSAYRGKYALWRWNWQELFALFRRLRAEHFAAAVSVRNDPRDHLFMLLAGAATRYGFPVKGSGVFLTHPLLRGSARQHKVKDWRDLGWVLDLPKIADEGPRLEHGRYRCSAVDQMFAELSKKPIVCLHPGARIGVRRWPEPYFIRIIEKLRIHFDFHLVLVPSPEGCSAALTTLADLVLRPLTVPELVDVLGRADIVLCNDSGLSRAHRGGLRASGHPDLRADRSGMVPTVGRSASCRHPRYLPVAALLRLLQVFRAVLHDQTPARARVAGDSSTSLRLARTRVAAPGLRESGVRRGVMKLSVAAVIATYRRPRELERLLDSLARSGSDLTAVIVVDNDGSEEIHALVQRASACGHYVNPGDNIGCGAGLRLGGEYALRLRGEPLTHLLILDDDAVLPPGTIAALAAAMEQGRADLAYPLVVGESGGVGWLPGLRPRTRGLSDAFSGSPEEFRARFGSEPRDFIWSQGICLLVARQAVERGGLHRGDFWVRGEDLEFSLRLTAQGRGILVPNVTVQHLPPAESAGLSRHAEYLKHCALLQNIAFIGFRLPHGHRIAWTLAGALRRFFRLWSWPAIGDAWHALWRGAILGEPAGTGAGRTFRARFGALHLSR